MSDPTLHGIDLGGDPVWIDREKWSKSAPIARRTLGGGVVVVNRLNNKGRIITITCYLSLTVLRQLCALRDAATSMVLAWYNSESYTVIFFDDGGLPIDHEGLIGDISDPDGEDLQFVTLKLMEI